MLSIGEVRMCVDCDQDERFSRNHPLNSKIKDTDLFRHGTSSKRYLAIQKARSLLIEAPDRNWGISEKGICFEKYDKKGQYLVDYTIEKYCNAACLKDGSSEGVVLEITGRDLKKLGCPIYVDWKKPINVRRDANGIPINIKSDRPDLSIILLDRDIPLRYLKVVKRMPFKG